MITSISKIAYVLRIPNMHASTYLLSRLSTWNSKRARPRKLPMWNATFIAQLDVDYQLNHIHNFVHGMPNPRA
jgi:hypothetical protein